MFKEQNTLNFTNPVLKISLCFYHKLVISKVTHFALLTHFTPFYPIGPLKSVLAGFHRTQKIS